jgi:hypothetical protein
MIYPTDLLHPSPAPHFKTFQVFLICCSKRPSFSTIQSRAPNVAVCAVCGQTYRSVSARLWRQEYASCQDNCVSVDWDSEGSFTQTAAPFLKAWWQKGEKWLFASLCLSFCLSVYLSAPNNSAPLGRIFMRFETWGVFEIFRENSSFIKIWQEQRVL